MDALKNFAKATVSLGYDAAATSIVLVAGGAARFPVVPFQAVWWNATDFSDPSDDPNVEIVRVTLIAGETLTITRAQEGITARAAGYSSAAPGVWELATGRNEAIVPATSRMKRRETTRCREALDLSSEVQARDSVDQPVCARS